MKIDKDININYIIRTIFLLNIASYNEQYQQQSVLEDAPIEMLDNIVHMLWSFV